MSKQQEGQLPNIIFILADDLGYGDVACYNPESKVPTPNLDQLNREGMHFADAHAPSTVCTLAEKSTWVTSSTWEITSMREPQRPDADVFPVHRRKRQKE